MAQEPEITPSDKKTTDRMFIKYAGIIFTFSFVLVCVIYYAGGYFFSSSLKDADVGTSVSDDLGYVLLMGVDRRDDDIGRSDTLMLAAVDEKKDRISLLSIPRDTRVEIGNYGYDKINHAYAFGGHDLTISSIRKLLGVPVSHYILIDTSAFERIVDAVGGVDLYVERDMDYEDPEAGLSIHMRQGYRHLDGAEAEQYLRYRGDDLGDLGRTQRQQKFVKAFYAKLLRVDTLPKIPQLADILKQDVTTSAELFDSVHIGNVVRKLNAQPPRTIMLPGDFARDDDTVWIMDRAATDKIIRELFPSEETEGEQKKEE